jgi:hypothetical protein
MGLDYNGTKFTLFAKTLDGVDFSETVTLGRQVLMVHPKELSYLLKKFHLPISKFELDNVYKSGDLKLGIWQYSEAFFKYLGANKIESIDASDYEGASIIHDMNNPLDDQHYARYTLLIDGGTLEHIFNFPIALKNCMHLLKKGGHFISITPANNQCGHGFYQFSPEVYFRAFSEQNGFRLRKILLSEVSSRKRWYEVSDPNQVGRRFRFRNLIETYIMVIAQKISDDATMRFAPQQSDYEHISWTGDNRVGRRLRYLYLIKELLPLPVLYLLTPTLLRLGGITPLVSPGRNLTRFHPTSGL